MAVDALDSNIEVPEGIPRIPGGARKSQSSPHRSRAPDPGYRHARACREDSPESSAESLVLQ